MATIANLLVTLGMNSSQFTNNAKSASSTLKNLGNTSNTATTQISSGMTGSIGPSVMAATAIIGVATALGVLAMKAIKTASYLAEIQNVVDVVFESSAGIINDFASTSVKQFGLSELAAKQYTGTLGAMFRAMDMSIPAAAGLSVTLTKLTGDMASFFNVDTETAFQKVRAGIAGEMEPLRQWGIILSVANLQAFALAKGIKLPYEAMSDGNKTLLRVAYLMQATTNAQGDYVRTSQGWANQTRLTTLTLGNLAKVIGNGLIPTLLPALQLFNQFLGVLVNVAQGFMAIQGPAKGFLMVGGFILALIPGLILGMYALSAAKAWYASITAGATAVVSGFNKALLMTLGIVGVVIVAIGALFYVLDKLGMIRRNLAGAYDTNEAKKYQDLYGAEAQGARAAAKGANALAGGLDKVKNSAKATSAAMRSLAGFDEINKLSSAASGAASPLIGNLLDQADLSQTLLDLASLQTSLDGIEVPALDTSTIVPLDILSLLGIADIDWTTTWETLKTNFKKGWDKSWADLVITLNAIWEWATGKTWTEFWDDFKKTQTWTVLKDIAAGLSKAWYWLTGKTWEEFWKDQAAGKWKVVKDIAAGLGKAWYWVTGKTWKVFWTDDTAGKWQVLKGIAVGLTKAWYWVTGETYFGYWFRTAFQEAWEVAKILFVSIGKVFRWATGMTWNQFWLASLTEPWEVVRDLYVHVNPKYDSSTSTAGILSQFDTLKDLWDTFWATRSTWQAFVKGQMNVTWDNPGDDPTLKKGFNGIIDQINGFLGTLNKVDIKMPALLGGSNIKFNTPTMTRMATGGIVTSPQIAMIGEHGKEAVMPLENNIGWIDELAGKLAGIMGGRQMQTAGTGNVSVYIGNDELDSHIVRANDRQSLRSNGR